MMDRWVNKIAVVTGASSGIGAAIVKDLIKANIIVVGLARRYDKMEKNRTTLPKDMQKRFHPLKCDLMNIDDIENSFEWIIKTLGGVDILINNAGIFLTGTLAVMDPKLIREIVDTNMMGYIHCTRLAFENMKLRKFDGHVIVMNSVAGHNVPHVGNIPSANMYPPIKFAITAIADTYRHEFCKLGTNIKITSISPGLVNTEMVPEPLRATKEILQVEDVSNAVMFAISTPPHVQICDIIMRPVGEKF